jgi:hypothetical protein
VVDTANDKGSIESDEGNMIILTKRDTYEGEKSEGKQRVEKRGRKRDKNCVHDREDFEEALGVRK